MHNEQLRLAGDVEAGIKKEAIEREAEANVALLTPEYVKLAVARAITANTKYYFSGEGGILTGLIERVMN